MGFFIEETSVKLRFNMTKFSVLVLASVLLIGCATGAPQRGRPSAGDRVGRIDKNAKPDEEVKQQPSASAGESTPDVPDRPTLFGLALPPAIAGFGAENNTPWRPFGGLLANGAIGAPGAGLASVLGGPLTNAPLTNSPLTNAPSAAGIGNGQAGGADGGPAVGTGTATVDAGPNGFGLALGIGGAIDTPFGTHTFGQGNAAAIAGPSLPFLPTV